MDLQLRREYFRQKIFAWTGAVLLLIFTAVFLAAAKTAATFHRPMPSPEMLPAPRDFEAAWTTVARWTVAAAGLLIVAAVIGLSFMGRQSWLQDDKKLAAGANPSADHSHAENEADASAGAEPPPAEAEVARAWPRFRGPDGAGISAFTNVPETWNAKSGQGIVWKTPVPLPGNNSPVIWGKRAFLSGADEKHRAVYCFDADSGKILWQKDVPGSPQGNAKPPEVKEDTGFAAATVATDGRRVFALFATGDLAVFDFSGKPVWANSLGLPENAYGLASSPIPYKNRLLVQFDQGGLPNGKSKLLAFNGATGKVVWQVPRPVPNSWSTPIVIRVGDRDEIITSSTPWVIAYDPKDGKEIWRANCMKNAEIGPSPVFAGGYVYVANDNAWLSAIRADGQGDVTATHIRWKASEGMPETCSPLATKDFVLLLATYGTMTCYDAAKGELLWDEDFKLKKDMFTSSPSLVGNRVYLIAESGKAWIVEPTREKCNRIAEADLGEECVTSPAFQDGRIYLRGKTHLFCIGK
jgi:outer membrane protein assembly factor BamB